MKTTGREDAAPDAGTRPAAPASGIRVPSTDAGRALQGADPPSAFERITFDDLARAQFLVDERILANVPLSPDEQQRAEHLVAAGVLAVCERCDVLVLPGERFCTRHAT